MPHSPMALGRKSANNLGRHRSQCADETGHPAGAVGKNWRTSGCPCRVNSQRDQAGRSLSRNHAVEFLGSTAAPAVVRRAPAPNARASGNSKRWVNSMPLSGARGRAPLRPGRERSPIQLPGYGSVSAVAMREWPLGAFILLFSAGERSRRGRRPGRSEPGDLVREPWKARIECCPIRGARAAAPWHRVR